MKILTIQQTLEFYHPKFSSSLYVRSHKAVPIFVKILLVKFFLIPIRQIFPPSEFCALWHKFIHSLYMY